MAAYLSHSIAEQAFADCKPYCGVLKDQTPALIQDGQTAYSDRKQARQGNQAIQTAGSINVGPSKDVLHKTAPAGY